MKKMKIYHTKLKSFKSVLRAFAKRSCPASRNGYLLIELLVAMTLFSIIIAVAVGSFINVLRTQRQVAALSAAQSNLGIVMEEMAREIRTGYSFCPSNADGSPDSVCNCNSENVCSALEFTDVGGDSIGYSVNASGVLEKSINGTAQEVTGGNVSVKYLNFILFGNIHGDSWNPRITITVGIKPNDASLSGNVLNLETTVSARQPD